MSTRFEPDCPEVLREIALTVHQFLPYCTKGEEIMAVGSILRFLEEFDEKNSSHWDASFVVIGQNDEFEHLVREISVQVDEEAIRLGSGEHFAPGPSLIDETVGYECFWINRGQEPENFLLDGWLSYSRLALKNVCHVEGVV